MPLFEIPKRPGIEQDAVILKKAKTRKKSEVKVNMGNGIVGLISLIKAKVENNLSQYKSESLLITDLEQLDSYITRVIAFGEVAIDTETTGLDPLQDTLVGISLYCDNEKAAYIPLNHVSYLTGERLSNQLSPEQVRPIFQRLADSGIEIDMFNAPFDTRMIKNGIGVRVHCTWDTSIASRLMNENEPEKDRGLKKLHQKYVLKGEGDAFKFDELFRGVTFDKIPIETGYVYAAHDAKITYEFKHWQQQFLYYDPETTRDDRNGMNGVSWVFFHIEMPIVDVVVDMEETGVLFDPEYNAVLKEKYHNLLDERALAFRDVYSKYDSDITAYRVAHPDCKLEDPINIRSTEQLAILLYDIIGCPLYYDKKKKKETRSTAEEALQALNNDVSKAILSYREFSTLVSTFIDKLPNCVNPKDKRIHCKFNQYGADTGRFSSSDPNLQNIPSHNKDIRKMFIASPGYVLMSSDFSQQEPKCLAALCKQQGDPQMYDTFMQGKDLYSEIASVSFHRAYEDCLEFYLDENGNKTDKTNKEGKEYRGQAKSILLGVLYGRSTASVAEQLGCSTDEAQAIKDSVFQGFPAIKKFENDSLEMAREIGYVTTVCGRKRRLPDLQLDKYEFEWLPGYANPYDDPLDFDNDMSVDGVPDSICDYYYDRLMKARYYKDRLKIIDIARQDGINVIDNGKKIGQATRQCVNARIQGSAADLTKLAMIELAKNERLKELGFRMLIPVHDEIIAECPEENVRECSKLLADTMSKAAEQILMMPIKCDVDISKAWYGEKIEL